jgi:SAM-dependent methyltransferase
MKCRHCGEPLEHTFLDLGFAPHSNAYLTKAQLFERESYFPLKLFVCEHCWLVQTIDYSRSDELFTDNYAYFSSVSKTWLNHAKEYADKITDRLTLDASSFVIEVASNDGYLLKNFVQAGIPCLGIEPTDSTATAAEALGVPVLREFFGSVCATDLAKLNKQADLIVGNNVYAHVPDINDFTQGLKIVLKLGGTITLEFPHLLNLIQLNQFDTVYHEHFSYLSVYTVQAIFQSVGLRVFDVEKIGTHGGSVRVYGCHSEDIRPTCDAVELIINEEQSFGLRDLSTYCNFQSKANTVKNDLLRFLLQAQLEGKKVCAYGAAAKGNTLLNYAGVKPDLIKFVCDAAASKQDKFMPGSHIPIVAPTLLKKFRPDYVLILPWNIAPEVIHANSFIRDWQGAFVTAVPALSVQR